MNVIDQISQLLEREGIAFTMRGDGTKIIIQAETASLDLTVDIKILSKQFEIQAALPVRVPENRRKEMCEMITRINWILKTGGFLMDMDDGELKFKIDGFIGQETFGEGEFEEFFDATIQRALSAMEDLHGIFLKIITFGITAQEGMEMVYVKNQRAKIPAKVPEHLIRMDSINTN
jgi:hypothetical protein